MMNLKECERKRSQPNFRGYPVICIEGLKKTMKTSARIADLQNENGTQDFMNSKQDRDI
jgi:hypothetical protein